MSISWTLNRGFGGYITIDYVPVAGGEPIERLTSSFFPVPDQGAEPHTPEEAGLYERAMAVGRAISSSLPESREELEVEGSVVRLPVEFSGLKVAVDAGTVELEAHRAPGQPAVFNIETLPGGQQRAIRSLSTTFERMAWEHLRGRLNLTSKGERLQVFISYRKRHEQFAERLAQRLGAEGFVPWFDKWDIRAGDSLPGKIEEGLEESIAFIPIMTADYQRGSWATEELQSAIAKRVEMDFRIVPVLLEECERPELIRHLRYVDFTAQDPETFESKVGELIDAIYGLTLNPFR